jgi:hypothetical protein
MFSLERATLPRNFDNPFRPAINSGAVLLEVILALVLFVGAAVIIGSALHAAANGVERLRLSAHAADLATSILSELQMGSRTPGDGSPEPLAPPFDTWMWQVQTIPLRDEAKPSATGSPSTAAGLMQVQVVVRDTASDFVYRLSQILPAESMRTRVEQSTTY